MGAQSESRPFLLLLDVTALPVNVPGQGRKFRLLGLAAPATHSAAFRLDLPSFPAMAPGHAALSKATSAMLGLLACLLDLSPG